MSYMDKIADEIGVKPDVLKILREDFKLGLKVSCVLLSEEREISNNQIALFKYHKCELR